MAEQNAIYLVAGASGAQGGATARALLAKGAKIRLLTRDATRVADLVAAGAEVAPGDFDDTAALARAMEGVTGVFSMQMPSPPNDPEAELRHGANLATVAKATGVEVFVHTSVARAGDQANFADWDEGRWPKSYWNGKSGVNDLVVEAGFPFHTILKPAFMMDNFARPKADFMFPALAQNRIETALSPDTRLDLVAAADVGAFAAAALTDPVRFNGSVIDLAAQSLTMDEAAHILAGVTGRTITACSLSRDAALAAGIFAGVVESHLWANVEGYRVDIAALAKWGLPMTSLHDWAETNRAAIPGTDM